jgi:hypothetical protein
VASAAQKAAQVKFRGAIAACRGASHKKPKGAKKSPFNRCVSAQFAKRR